MAEDRRSAVDVTLHDATACMHPEKHPQVVAGRISAQQVENDFCAFFDFRDHPLGEEPPVPPMLTLKGFKDYYTDVGVCEPYDAVFIPMIEALWGVEEPRPLRDTCRHLSQALHPKLLQRSRNAETPTEVLRKTMRYYSQPNGQSGGVIAANGVERALNSFGLYPDDGDIQDVLAAVGSSAAELHEVDKVVAVLCSPEPSTPSMF